MLTGVPPWLVISAILGVIHASLFHLLLGDRLHQLPAALGLGLAGSMGGGLLGTLIPPSVLALGETNLIATAALAWTMLLVGRLFRIC